MPYSHMHTTHSWHACMGTLNTCTQTLVHTSMHKHTQARTQIHKCTHACMHTHTHTYTQTHMHTYTPHSHTYQHAKPASVCGQDHMVTLLPTTLHLHVLYVYTSDAIHLDKLQASTWMFRAVGPHQCSATQQNTYQTTQSHTRMECKHTSIMDHWTNSWSI